MSIKKVIISGLVALTLSACSKNIQKQELEGKMIFYPVNEKMTVKISGQEFNLNPATYYFLIDPNEEVMEYAELTSELYTNEGKLWAVASNYSLRQDKNADYCDPVNNIDLERAEKLNLLYNALIQ